MPRDYLQHGSRHHPQFGSDPTPGLGISNDWVIADCSLGTVTNGSSPVNGAFSSITYQTDDGSIFDIYTGGSVDVVEILVVGTYLIRAIADFTVGRTGTIQLQGVIGGDVTTYDFDTAAGSTSFTDIGPGVAYWSQLCVVNDLSAHAGAYLTFTQTTGSSMASCQGHLQIFRLT